MGLRPEKTKPCTFPAKSRYSFRREHKKLVAEALVYLSRERRTTSATFLRSISAKLSTYTCPGGGSQTRFHIPEKFPLWDQISRKNVFLGYPVCAQPTGHGKRSATPRLFPSSGGHPTDLSFLGDFCRGMYRFPLSWVELNISLCHSIGNGKTSMPIFLSNRLARGAIVSPICNGY